MEEEWKQKRENRVREKKEQTTVNREKDMTRS